MEGVGCVSKWREREQSCGAQFLRDQSMRDGKGTHFKENKECLVPAWRAEQEGIQSFGSRKNGRVGLLSATCCLMGGSFQVSPPLS